jgi:hypothetical protein
MSYLSICTKNSSSVSSQSSITKNLHFFLDTFITSIQSLASYLRGSYIVSTPYLGEFLKYLLLAIEKLIALTGGVAYFITTLYSVMSALGFMACFTTMDETDPLFLKIFGAVLLGATIILQPVLYENLVKTWEYVYKVAGMLFPKNDGGGYFKTFSLIINTFTALFSGYNFAGLLIAQDVSKTQGTLPCIEKTFDLNTKQIAICMSMSLMALGMTAPQNVSFYFKKKPLWFSVLQRFPCGLSRKKQKEVASFVQSFLYSAFTALSSAYGALKKIKENFNPWTLLCFIIVFICRLKVYYDDNKKLCGFLEEEKPLLQSSEKKPMSAFEKLMGIIVSVTGSVAMAYLTALSFFQICEDLHIDLERNVWIESMIIFISTFYGIGRFFRFFYAFFPQTLENNLSAINVS